jgi:hypothetical protein
MVQDHRVGTAFLFLVAIVFYVKSPPSNIAFLRLESSVRSVLLFDHVLQSVSVSWDSLSADLRPCMRASSAVQTRICGKARDVCQCGHPQGNTLAGSGEKEAGTEHDKKPEQREECETSRCAREGTLLVAVNATTEGKASAPDILTLIFIAAPSFVLAWGNVLAPVLEHTC